MRTLVLYTPANRPLRNQASLLADELHWRGFDAEVEAAGAGRDVSDYRLVVLVFPVLHVPFKAVPMGGIERVVSDLRGLSGQNVALLAVTPLDVGKRLCGLKGQLERLGGSLVATGNALPGIRGQRGMVDLAAECMVRVPA